MRNECYITAGRAPQLLWWILDYFQAIQMENFEISFVKDAPMVLPAVVVDFLVILALMIQLIDSEAHLRSLLFRASPMKSLPEMVEVEPTLQWLFSQLRPWKMMNVNKFLHCPHLPAASWNLWKNLLVNNFLHMPFLLIHNHNMHKLNNLQYMINHNSPKANLLHCNHLAFQPLSNSDDDMNSKSLWCCQDPLWTCSSTSSAQSHTLFTTTISR